MKLKSLVAAVALVASGVSAYAVDTPLGTLTEDPSLIGGTVSGLFSKGYSFSLASLSDVFGGVSSFMPGVFTGVSISDGLSTLSDNDASDGFLFTGVAAGDYTLTVFGFSSKSAPIGGYIAATPVPEPETYAMMLAGLAAVGFLARRRQNG